MEPTAVFIDLLVSPDSTVPVLRPLPRSALRRSIGGCQDQTDGIRDAGELGSGLNARRLSTGRDDFLDSTSLLVLHPAYPTSTSLRGFPETPPGSSACFRSPSCPSHSADPGTPGVKLGTGLPRPASASAYAYRTPPRSRREVIRVSPSEKNVRSIFRAAESGSRAVLGGSSDIENAFEVRARDREFRYDLGTT